MDTLSLRLDTPALDLRVGHHSRGGAARTVGRQACLAQKQELGPDNPWALDALLAVTADTAGRDNVAPGGLVLGTLRECMWEVPASDEEPTLLLPELLAAVDSRCDTGSERKLLPERAQLTLIFVKRGNYYVGREGAAPAYLLRGETLRPLAPAPKTEASRSANPAPAAPRVESGPLEDGDALVCANVDLERWLDATEIRRALEQSLSPRAAAARLADQAGDRGAPDIAVSVLFAGDGPGSGPRREPTGSFVAAPAQALTPSAVIPPSLPPPLTPRSRLNIGTLAASLIGGLLGIGGGVALVVMMLRTGGSAEPTTLRVEPQQETVPYVASGTPAPTEPPITSTSNVASGLSNSAEPSPPAPAAIPPPPAAIAPATVPPGGRLQSGTRSATPKRVLAAPPVVPLASGMSSRVSLQLTLDTARGLLLVTANQGNLYSPEVPRGVPVGTVLPVPLDGPLRERLADGQGELRLEPVPRNGVVPPAVAVHGADLERLLQGMPVPVRDVTPGDYRLVGSHPAQQPFMSPTAMVGVGGL